MVLIETKSRLSLFLVLVLLPVLLSGVGEARGDYAVSIGASSVSVTITTIFQENMTVALPTYNLTLSGVNASSAEALFTSALSSLAPGVRVTGLQIISSSTSNVTRTTVSFNVEGSATSSHDRTRISVAWKSFKVGADITAGGFSLNSVGRYLAASPVLNQQSSSLISWTYFENGRTIPYTQSLEAASSFFLLDFSQLSTPVDAWPREFNPERGATVTLTNRVSHNITARETTNEPEGPVKDVFLAGYSHNVQITVAGFATALGDVIVLDASVLTTGTMLALVVVFPLTGLTVFLVERRFTGASRSQARKRSRGRPKS